MTKFEIGDIVYIKDKIVERYKYSEQDRVTALAPDQSCPIQVGLAKDIPLTIIGCDENDINNRGFYITNFTDNWGREATWKWKAEKYRVWFILSKDLEKRSPQNKVSLLDLNRDL